MHNFTVLGALAATDATVGQPLFENIPLVVVYLIRIFVAGLLGLTIGIERRRRQKEAGVATHFIVGCATALFTCLSLYLSPLGDGERIAAQVVSGISFLGAGVIFFRRENLRGLTTAAGIWATAAIGMCVASGLYILGVSVTAIILIFQVLLHSRIIKRNSQHLLFIKMVYTDEVKEEVFEFFGCSNFHRFKVTATMAKNLPEVAGQDVDEGETDENAPASTLPGTRLIAEAVIYPTKNCSADAISQFVREKTEILSIERLEDL